MQSLCGVVGLRNEGRVWDSGMHTFHLLERVPVSKYGETLADLHWENRRQNVIQSRAGTARGRQALRPGHARAVWSGQAACWLYARNVRGSPRISLRLKKEDLVRLRAHCEEAGLDVSRAVRRAVQAYLATNSGSGAANVPARRLSPPEAIMKFVPPYLAWGRGDPREERNRLFVAVLAAAFACKKLYPRAAGTLEGYEGLLELCKFFGLD